jgi:hypothetical protein
MPLLDASEIDNRLKVFISGSMQTIEGYLSQDEAAVFSMVGEHQVRAGVTGDIAEFGVWRGRSALLLYQLLRMDEKLFAVDLFDLRNRSHPYFNDPAIFMGHCERLGAVERTQILKVDTTVARTEVSEAIRARSCRIVHVDGGHTYRIAKVDIDSAFRAVTDDGVVVCDDILARKFPGVTQAFVEASLANPDFVPFALTRKKVWSAHRKNAETYKSVIESATKKSWPTSTFMGGEMLVID